MTNILRALDIMSSREESTAGRSAAQTLASSAHKRFRSSVAVKASLATDFFTWRYGAGHNEAYEDSGIQCYVHPTQTFYDGDWGYKLHRIHFEQPRQDLIDGPLLSEEIQLFCAPSSFIREAEEHGIKDIKGLERLARIRIYEDKTVKIISGEDRDHLAEFSRKRLDFELEVGKVVDFIHEQTILDMTPREVPTV